MNIPFINLQETCPHTMKETAMPQYMQISWWQSLSILYDNLGCLQWWKSWHHKKSLFSVSMVLYRVQQGEGWSTDWTLFSRQTPHNLTSGPSYFGRKFTKLHTCQVTLDISRSPIDFQWGSRKYPGQLDRYDVITGPYSSMFFLRLWRDPINTPVQEFLDC